MCSPELLNQRRDSYQVRLPFDVGNKLDEAKVAAACTQISCGDAVPLFSSQATQTALHSRIPVQKQLLDLSKIRFALKVLDVIERTDLPLMICAGKRRPIPTASCLVYPAAGGDIVQRNPFSACAPYTSAAACIPSRIGDDHTHLIPQSIGQAGILS